MNVSSRSLKIKFLAKKLYKQDPCQSAAFCLQKIHRQSADPKNSADLHLQADASSVRTSPI